MCSRRAEDSCLGKRFQNQTVFVGPFPDSSTMCLPVGNKKNNSDSVFFTPGQTLKNVYNQQLT